MFGDTIFYDAHEQVTLNLKQPQRSGLSLCQFCLPAFSIKYLNKSCHESQGKLYFSDMESEMVQLKFKLIEAIMVVLVTYKNEDQIKKMKAIIVVLVTYKNEDQIKKMKALEWS